MTEIARLEKNTKEAMDVAYEAKNKIDAHESVCELRYAGIQVGMGDIKDDIKTLGTRMWIASGSVIAVCITVIAVLLTKG